LLLVGAVLVRLPNLNESLWFDEVMYTGPGLRGEALRWVLFHDVHPPLYALVIWGWIQLFGDSEIAVRLPSLLCGVASVAVTFALARRWFGAPIAFLSAGLVALSPAHIWYSHENKTNMLLVFLTVSSVWAVDRAWTSNRGAHWLLFITLTALALWTNAFALWVVVAVLLWVWAGVAQRRWRDRLPGAVAASVVLACAYLPLVLSAASHFDSLRRSYLRPFTLAEAYKLLLICLSHGNTLRTISPYASFDALFRQPWPFFLVEGFFAGALVAGLAQVTRSLRPRSDAARQGGVLLCCYFFVPLLLVLVASSLYPQIYIERSMLILLPPYVMLIALGVLSLPRPALRVVGLATLLALNGWALANLWVTKADVWTVYKPKNDWRAAAQFLGGEMRDAGAPLMIFATVPASALVYYDHRIVELVDDVTGAGEGKRAVIRYISGRDRGFIASRLRAAGTERFYLIEDTYWSGGFQQLFADVTGDANFEPVGERSFKGLKVFAFRWLGKRGD
jgi:4-amino-4-deoxy-L-arabinose transferase-like glycosyltransferase